MATAPALKTWQGTAGDYYAWQLNSGLDVVEIAAATGVSVQAVYHALNIAGYKLLTIAVKKSALPSGLQEAISVRRRGSGRRASKDMSLLPPEQRLLEAVKAVLCGMRQVDARKEFDLKHGMLNSVIHGRRRPYILARARVELLEKSVSGQ